jgi:GNAT superfamily N-acetyltransferase
LTNRNNQPSWQTQPRTTKAQDKFRSELRRNGRPTRPTELQSRVRDILARPGARTSTGQLNPRVVSTEEARLIVRLQSQQPTQPTPFQRRGTIRDPLGVVTTGFEAGAETGLAAFQGIATAGPKISAPFLPSFLPRVPVESVERSRQSLREIGQAITGRRGVGETIGGLAERQRERPIVEQLAAGVVFDPLNLLPVVGFGPDIMRGLRAISEATPAAAVALRETIQQAPRTLSGMGDAILRTLDDLGEGAPALRQQISTARLRVGEQVARVPGMGELGLQVAGRPGVAGGAPRKPRPVPTETPVTAPVTEGAVPTGKGFRATGGGRNPTTGETRWTIKNDGSEADMGLKDDGEGFFVDLITPEELRRQGFAEALIRDGIRYLSDRGATSIRLYSERGVSRELFKKLGFKETGVRTRLGDREQFLDRDGIEALLEPAPTPVTRAPTPTTRAAPPIEAPAVAPARAVTTPPVTPVAREAVGGAAADMPGGVAAALEEAKVGGGSQTPPNAPSGTMSPDDADDAMRWFSDFIDNPESIEAWEQTQRWRSQVLAGRAGTLQSRTLELIQGGVPVEEAMNQATRESLSGPLPRVEVNIGEVVAPELRAALFSRVYSELASEPLEMVSTVEALTNALMGRPIPRKVGTAGGSAFTRLRRVFPANVIDALDGGGLEDYISLQMAPSPTGVSEEARAFAASIPERSVLGGEQTPRLFEDPFEARQLAPDPRTDLEREFELRRLRADIEGRPLDVSEEARSLARGIPEEGALGGASTMRLFEEPFVARQLAPDPRTSFQKELDLQVFKLGLADQPVQLDAALRMADPIDAEAVKQIMGLPSGQRNVINTIARETGRTTIDVFNFIRGNMASVDVSWPRQMAMLIFGHPTKFTNAMASSLRSLWDAPYAKRIMDAIEQDPDFIWYQRVGADFLRPLDGKQFRRWEELSNLAEDYMILGGERPLNRLAANLPWLRISARAHVTGINAMAWKIFKQDIKNILKINEQYAAGIKKVPEGGFSVESNIREAAKMLADMSGRGPLGPLKSLSPALNAGFFSARLALGRLLSPRHLFSKYPYVRKQAWRNFISGIAGFSALMLGGEKMGLWEVEKDPRSADFMKARIGPIRIDPWGGYQQYAVLYGRLLSVLATGQIETKSSTTGQLNPADPIQLASQFTRNKLAPGISNVLEMWTGKDFKGDKIDRLDWQRWLRRNGPLSAMDIYESFEAEGLVGLAAGGTSLTGGGVQVYDLPRWPELDEYYKLDDDRERRLYRIRNPENEAKLFIRGQFTTISSQLARNAVQPLMRQHNVSPVDVPGYEKVFKSLTLPKSRATPSVPSTGPTQEMRSPIRMSDEEIEQIRRDIIEKNRVTPEPVGVR